jgi:hypothetical protein
MVVERVVERDLTMVALTAASSAEQMESSTAE